MSKQNKTDNTKMWIRILCGFMGALMVFGIVVMVISTFMSSVANAAEETGGIEPYTVSTSEISVGLCYASSAAQCYLLSCKDKLNIVSDGFSIAQASYSLNVSVDDNLYIYNGAVTNNPLGVGVLGGYHIRISFLQSGDGSSSGDNDNPVFIVPGVSGGSSDESIFTKDNVKEYVSQFNSSSVAQKLGVYAFPSYIDGEFYMNVGEYKTEEDALETLTKLQNEYIINAEIAAPDKDVLSVHTDEYKILFETDGEENLEIHSSGDNVINNAFNEDYYGYFRFYRDNTEEKSAMQVINTLDIDEYVKSVMSVELSDAYSAEMLKASAVVFRTAAHKMLIDHKLRNFDVCANSHCRIYKGCASVSERISNAVDAVSGLVLTYEDEIIYPVYSESCGSTTLSLEDSIGVKCEYLKSIQTNWEMTDGVYDAWKSSISSRELYEKLTLAGYTELESGIKTVTVDRRSGNSIYATAVTFTDVLGNSVTVEGAEKIRTVLDGVVESTAFIVGKSGSKITYGYYAENGEYAEGTRTLEGVVGYFVFCGEGYGTGVGYSLSGAEILAKQGEKYDSILFKYFLGVELAQLKTD